MAARIEIPLAFPEGAPPPLKRDLERFAKGVYDYTQNAPRIFAARPDPKPQTAGFLSFDTAVPFELLSGQSATVPLPRPDARNGGRKCTVIRRLATGIVDIVAVGCLVDGAETYRLSSALGFTEFLFDGQNYWSSRAGAAEWGV